MKIVFSGDILCTARTLKQLVATSTAQTAAVASVAREIFIKKGWKWMSWRRQQQCLF
jgi:hypothetical protein